VDDNLKVQGDCVRALVTMFALLFMVTKEKLKPFSWHIQSIVKNKSNFKKLLPPKVEGVES
jgi:hypothetical protein